MSTQIPKTRYVQTSRPVFSPAAADEAERFEQMLAEFEFRPPRRGQVLEGAVVTLNEEGLLVDVGAKRDAVVSRRDLHHLDEAWLASLAAGDEVPVYVLRTPDGDDELQVSLRRGLQEQDWRRAESCLENQELLELEIIGRNKGGLLLAFDHLTAFVPNSHVPQLRFVRQPEARDAAKSELMGQLLPVKIIDIDRRRRRLVASAREAHSELRRRRIRELTVGEVVTGRVESLAEFGAFVELGGVTGLVHISRLDWQRVDHPRQVLSVGDEVQVLIQAIDEERGRISLNRQAVLPDPWDGVADQVSVGDVLQGVVTNVVDFGLFVELPMGVEGLVHVTEMPPADPAHLTPPYAAGDPIQVRVIRVDARRKRLGLSLKPALDWQPELPTQDGTDPQPRGDDSGL